MRGPRGRPVSRPGFAALVLVSALASAWLAAACATGGREIVEGVRYYPASEGEVERWQGSWQDVPILVVIGRTGGEGVRGARSLAVRDALRDQLPGRRDLWRPVVPGEAAGDTLGELLWRPLTSSSRECVGYDIVPGDSVRLQRTICNRTETSSMASWNPSAIQRAAVEVGGNAVLLVREEHAGTFRGLRGWVLRCPEGGSGPICAG